MNVGRMGHNDEIVLSNIVRMIKDYQVSCHERTLFDWLVFTQRGFGAGKPFRHSIQQVETATAISRHLQNKTFGHFADLGFLKLGKDTFNNNEYRSFFVDYSVLVKKEVLGQIVREGTETFANMLKMFTAWAKEQAKGEKPVPKREQKIIAAKLDAVEPLLNRLSSLYADRVEKYNSGWLTGTKPKRTKSSAKLVCAQPSKKQFVKLMEIYDNDSICNAFMAYTDSILKGETKTTKIIPYFLTFDDGDYVVANRFMEYYTLNYGHKQA